MNTGKKKDSNDDTLGPMEGMVQNANRILDRALEHTKDAMTGVPPRFFKHCKGIVLLSVVEAGVGITGTHGTGIIMSQNEYGKWSGPSALTLTAIGLGAIFGADGKDIIILIFHDETMSKYKEGKVVAYGTESASVMGPLGTDSEINDFLMSGKANNSISYTYSKGVFLGVALEGATIRAKMDANEKFYGSDEYRSPNPILNGGVDVPKGSAVPELHKKLDLLKEGPVAAARET